MKNNQIFNSWNKIKPSKESEKRMLEAILSREHSPINRKINWKKVAPIAACLILTISIMIPILNKSTRDFYLVLSKGVDVRYIDEPPTGARSENQLLWLSEDELFEEKFGNYQIVIFRGTVLKIDNIVCDYDGSKDYRAIATIRINEKLRGEIKSGDIVTVLLPGPVENGVEVEDTSISSSISVGEMGIFLPIKYDETSIRVENGKTLVLTDLAEYGMLDGMRYMFIEKKDGLIYDKDAYPSFAKAKNLQDVEETIGSMIK